MKFAPDSVRSEVLRFELFEVYSTFIDIFEDPSSLPRSY